MDSYLIIWVSNPTLLYSFWPFNPLNFYIIVLPVTDLSWYMCVRHLENICFNSVISCSHIPCTYSQGSILFPYLGQPGSPQLNS